MSVVTGYKGYEQLENSSRWSFWQLTDPKQRGLSVQQELFLSAALYNRGLHCGCRRHFDNCETCSGVQRVVFVQMDPLDKSHSAQSDCEFSGCPVSSLGSNSNARFVLQHFDNL